MKTKKSIIILLFIAISSVFMSSANAAIVGGGKETVVIQTSGTCGECKARIETALLEMKGVSNAKLSLKDMKVTVTFDSGKVTLEQIKQTINKAGYDADDMKADPTAYENLPGCCKKGGH